MTTPFADPPWLDEAASNAFGIALSYSPEPFEKWSVRGLWRNVVRSVLAFAAQQPPEESWQCPACNWHKGHDPAEWMREEMRLRHVWRQPVTEEMVAAAAEKIKGFALGAFKIPDEYARGMAIAALDAAKAARTKR